jgi:lysophospholipase L1-like esterase
MKFKNLLLTVLALASSFGTMFADEPFRQHRYDSFKACEVNENSIVFIGNSITNMGEWWEFFSCNPNVVNRGNSGCYSYESLDQIESILVGRPAKIFLMVGTNDIGGAVGTPETVAANTRQIIDRVQTESPKTEIYITSVFPSDNGLRNTTNLGNINKLLKPLCEEKGVTYVDLWDDLQGILDGTLSFDHLHLKPTGYRIWCEKVAPYVGSPVVFTDDNMVLNQSGQSYSYGMRSQQFGCLPVKSTDVLIVGDELVHGGEWHELLHSDRVKGRGTVWGYGGISIAQHTAMLEATLATNPNIKEQPAQIYFFVGLQALNADATTVETMATDYETMVKKAIELAPNSKLFLCGLTPHATAARDTKTKEFNAKLEEIAAAYDNCTYIDTYTPMTTADGARDAELVNGNNYITGKGYIRLARTIAPYIGTDVSVMTDDEFDAHYALINARQALGSSIVTAKNITVGTTTGTYTAEGVAPLLAKVEDALALLAKDGATVDEIQAASAELETLAADAKKALNQPVEGKFYTLQTPNRDSRYLTDSQEGTLKGGDTAESTAAQWKFELREDGSYNIVNRYTNRYLTPGNSPLTTGTAVPSAGWTLGPCGTMSLYIITSGTVQLNQTNSGLGYAIYNWGYGTVTTGEFNTTDAGCLYSITELADDAPAINPEKLVLEPTPSTNKETYWHQMCTPLRETRYVTEVDGGLDGVTTPDGEASQWKIVAREDGTYDIVNRATSNFVLPTATFNTQLKTGSESPAAGWEFKAAATSGYYIVVSGSSEFNQTNSSLGYKVYNWGSGTNTSDAGCQYLFKVVDVEEEPESGISTVVVTTDGAATDAIYDIQGRQVREAVRPGLYIIGGRKKVVR